MSSSSVSSSSETPQEKYDVFLSFRGKDVRTNFTGHLYKELRSKGIEPFKDNEELRRGDEISPSLIKAIETSLILVVILSKNYATSPWCLDELDKILECMKMYGRIVIPIFYHVDQTDVSNQMRSFGNAFAKHEKNPKLRSDKLKRWRGALTEVADLAGWNSSDFRDESKFIEEIVQDIIKKLKNKSSSDDCDVEDGLVGLDSRIHKIEQMLSIGSMGVGIVGIWGLGGIGKTTLARAVFNKICSKFEIPYFIKNIRDTEEKIGLTSLRQDLFSKILDDKDLNVGTLCQPDTFTKERLRRKNVLIVFDDVTKKRQIEDLIGGLDWFGSTSRIILTSRDEQILHSCGVHEVYRLWGLPYGDALKLFSLNAFGQSHPLIDHLELSDWVVRYIDGLPLALTVFGSHLRNRTKEQRESAVQKLKEIPDNDVQEVLKISYDGLDDEEKRILLDITCLLNQYLTKQKVIDILNARGFYPEIGLSVLTKKCLINISEGNLTMHDLVQQMVKEIVRRDSIDDPGKRVRLWDHEDISKVLNENKDTEKIEGICLDISRIDYINLHPQAFAKMPNLRIFNFYKSGKENNVHLSEDLVGSMFTKLRYFRWDECPLKSLPLNFHHENLVEIDMSHSKVEELWYDVQHFPNLKYLNVQHSERLAKIPDLSKAQNLERLDLYGCSSLAEVHPSIQNLKKLIYLKLGSCENLTSLPTLMSLESLKELYLQGCSELEEIPELPCNLEYLRLSETPIKQLHETIGMLSSLKSLDLGYCKSLDLSGCSDLDCSGNLEEPHEHHADGREPSGSSHLTVHPTDFGCLSSLHELDLSFLNFKNLPKGITDHPCLRILTIAYCEELQSLPDLPHGLVELLACGCKSLKEITGLPPLFRETVENCTSHSENLEFNFSECFKLNSKTVEDAVERALLNIQFKRPRNPEAMVRYPGSEVPEWFKFQNTGSSITFELQPGWCDENFIGFALCTVVEAREGFDGQIDIRCKFELISNNNSRSVDLGTAYYYNPEPVGFDEVVIRYNLRKFDHFDENKNANRASVQFLAQDSLGEQIPIEYCNVIKCGIHILYANGIKEPQPKRPKTR